MNIQNIQPCKQHKTSNRSHFIIITPSSPSKPCRPRQKQRPSCSSTHCNTRNNSNQIFCSTASPIRQSVNSTVVSRAYQIHRVCLILYIHQPAQMSMSRHNHRLQEQTRLRCRAQASSSSSVSGNLHQLPVRVSTRSCCAHCSHE